MPNLRPMPPAPHRAPHVQAAVTRVLQRSPAPARPTLAPHVQAALGRTAQPRAMAPGAAQPRAARVPLPSPATRPAPPGGSTVQPFGNIDPIAAFVIGTILFLGLLYVLHRLVNGAQVPLRAVSDADRGSGKASPMGDTCTVCAEDFRHGDDVVELPCKHRFHRACILKWFEKRRNCPNCKASWEGPLSGARRDPPDDPEDEERRAIINARVMLHNV